MAAHWCTATLQRIVSDLARFDGERRIRVDELDFFEVQLELVYRELVCGEALGNLTNQASESVDFVCASLELVHSMLQESTSEPPVQGYSAPIINSGQCGRPTFLIPRNQLAFLLDKRFSVPQIASLLRVSMRTVRR